MSNSQCTKTCTYTETSKPSECATTDTCVLGSASGNKTYYSVSCTTCATGYKMVRTPGVYHGCYKVHDCNNHRAAALDFCNDENDSEFEAISENPSLYTIMTWDGDVANRFGNECAVGRWLCTHNGDYYYSCLPFCAY